MDDNRLQKQMEFCRLIDAEKKIGRQTYLADASRKENDAEHAWHMAIMAYLLKEYANEPVDIAKVMLMCLIHDIVEIDAGDTFAYDEAAKITESAREEAAKERLFSLLPADQAEEFAHLFEEFTACATPEAKFANAMDNIQPLLLNDSNDGYDWKENSVPYEKVLKRHNKTKMGSSTLYSMVEDMLSKNVAKGNLK